MNPDPDPFAASYLLLFLSVLFPRKVIGKEVDRNRTGSLGSNCIRLDYLLYLLLL